MPESLSFQDLNEEEMATFMRMLREVGLDYGNLDVYVDPDNPRMRGSTPIVMDPKTNQMFRTLPEALAEINRRKAVPKSGR